MYTPESLETNRDTPGDRELQNEDEAGDMICKSPVFWHRPSAVEPRGDLLFARVIETLIASTA